MVKKIGVLAFIFLYCLTVTNVEAQGDTRRVEGNTYLSETYHWIQDGKQVHAWLDNQYVVELLGSNQQALGGIAAKEIRRKKMGLIPSHQVGNLFFWQKVVGPLLTRASVDTLTAQEALLPVFRMAPFSSAPYLIPGGGVIILIKDDALESFRQWAVKNSRRMTSIAAGSAWLIETQPGNDTLSLVSEVASLPYILTVAPDWIKQLKAQ
jgi:hypothetical protein